jgi:acetolactate synthase-1/2/3 large subunit
MESQVQRSKNHKKCRATCHQKVFSRLLLPQLKHKPRATWFAQINEWKRKHPFRFEPSLPGKKLKPQRIIEELDIQTRDIKDKVIITTGVGQHQMWAAQYFRWRHPRTFITSGGLGTMVYGLPAAIGAKAGSQTHIVVGIDGDGSLSMTGLEMLTAAQFGIGVKVLLLNNDFQGMVKQ